MLTFREPDDDRLIEIDYALDEDKIICLDGKVYRLRSTIEDEIGDRLTPFRRNCCVF